jgi:glucose/arabinose dehydrogenase
MLVTQRDNFNIAHLSATGDVIASVPVPNTVTTGGEGGLMGIAIDPGFALNNTIYISHTVNFNGGYTPNGNEVASYTYDPTTDTLSNHKQLLTYDAGSFHNGGAVSVGPDGKLYISTGNGTNPGTGNGPFPELDTTNPANGKIDRINTDGSIPSDNPFGNAVWTIGHRNPQGLGWQGTALWGTENGPTGEAFGPWTGISGNDKINLLVKGSDYGFPLVYGPNTTTDPMGNMTVAPAATSGDDETWAPEGIVYFGNSIFYGALGGIGNTPGTPGIDQAVVTGTSLGTINHILTQFGRIRAMVIGPDNMLYFSTSNTDGRGSPMDGDDHIYKVDLSQFTGGQCDNGSTSSSGASTSSSSGASTSSSGASTSSSSGSTASSSSGSSSGASSGSSSGSSSGPTITAAAGPDCWTNSGNPMPAGKSAITVVGKVSASITDAQGNVWTMSPEATALINGKVSVYSQNVVQVVLVNNVIYQQNVVGYWWSWTGTTWLAANAAPTLTSSTPTISSGITQPTAFSTTDANGNTITMQCGQVLVNGQALSNGECSNIEITNGQLVADCASGNANLGAAAGCAVGSSGGQTCTVNGSTTTCGSGVTNGMCGSVNGTTVNAAPTSGLCSSGTATTVSLIGNTYTWQCVGSGSFNDVDACTALQGSVGGSSGGMSSSGGTSSSSGSTSSSSGTTASSSSGGTATGQFHVQGGQIIAPNGQTFIARGINVADRQMGDAQAILQAFPGINFIRLAAYSYADPSSYQDFVNTMTAQNVVVEIEEHLDSNGGTAGGGQGQVFSGGLLQTEQSWFGSIASAYANNPYVWFGTDNEPSEDPSAGALSDWQLQTYQSIRNAGNNSIIMIEMDCWHAPIQCGVGYNTGNYANMTNAVWDDHFYAWLVDDSTDQNTVNQGLAQEISSSQQLTSGDGTMPVIIGEWGVSTTGSSDDGDDSQVIAAVLGSGYGNAPWHWGQQDCCNNLGDNNGLTAFGQAVANSIAKGATGAPSAGIVANVSKGVTTRVSKAASGIMGTVTGNNGTTATFNPGQVTAAATTGRNYYDQPGGNGSVWNTPLGDGAIWGNANDPDTQDLRKGGNINSPNNFGQTSWIGSTSDPTWQVTAGATRGDQADGTLSMHVPAGVYAPGPDGGDNNIQLYDPVDYFGMVFCMGDPTNIGGGQIQGGLRETDDATADNFGEDQETGLLGYDVAAGMIRKFDVDQINAGGHMRHMLRYATDAAYLKDASIDGVQKLGPNSWPQAYEDYQTPGINLYNGNLPAGTTVGIPMTTAMPAGLTQGGQELFWTLQHYGALFRDQAGGGMNFADDQDADTTDIVNGMKQDAATIVQLLAPLRNQHVGGQSFDTSPKNGPGNRVDTGPLPLILQDGSLDGGSSSGTTASSSGGSSSGTTASSTSSSGGSSSGSGSSSGGTTGSSSGGTVAGSSSGGCGSSSGTVAGSSSGSTSGSSGTTSSSSGTTAGSSGSSSGTCTASSSGSSTGSSSGTSTGAFHVEGGQIIDPDGNLFVAHGINVGPEDIADLEANLTNLFPGINFLRMADGERADVSTYQDFVTQMAAKKIVVEIEDHPWPLENPLQGGDLDAESQWYAGLASAFANNPYVWFGTMNEPQGDYGDPNEANLTAQQFATYNAVRGAGNNTIIMCVAGVGGGNPGAVGPNSGLTVSTYAQMSNIAWDIHFYGWAANMSTDQATVNGVLLGSVADSAGTAAAEAIQSADGTMPLIIGEYGDSTDGQSQDPDWQQVLQAVQTSGYGSAAWHWGVLAGADILNQGTTLTTYGQEVAGYIASASSQLSAGLSMASSACTSSGGTSSTGSSSGGVTDGACGSANGATFNSAPTTGLCTSGTPTTLTLIGNTWTWQCVGTGNFSGVDACGALKGGSSSSSSSGGLGGGSSSGSGLPTPIPGAGAGQWQSADLPFNGLPSGQPFHYDFLLPADYSTTNKYPLIFYEHEDCEGDNWYYGGGDPLQLVGAGMMEFDSFNTDYYRQNYPSIVIVPYADQQGGCNDTVYNFGGYGDTPGSDPNEQAVAALAQYFMQNYPVNPNKVYVTGDSLGGIGSWALALDYNTVNGTVGHVFTAFMPFAGVIERGGFSQSDGQRMASVPIFAVSGAGDTTSRVQDWNEPLWQLLAGNGNYPPAPGAQAGSTQFHYLEDPGLGHDVWNTYRDFTNPNAVTLYNWLFSQGN